MAAGSRLLLLAMVLLTLHLSQAAKGKKNDIEDQTFKRMEEMRRQHEMEMRHLSKIKSHEVDDWTLHHDVDGSIYWFSRTLKRSEKDPPKGWTKDSKGVWKAPPRKHDGL
jgi:hypothetical protein